MPTSFYIVMGCLGVVGGIAIISSFIVGKRAKEKTSRLFAEMQRSDALAQSECMVRNGAIHCPGVALIAESTLTIKTIFDKVIELPVPSVTVLKEGRLGHNGWIGKKVFFLDAPETSNLAIGVKEPDPWRKAFGISKNS